MKDLEEGTIDTKEIYQGKIINLRVDQVKLPNGQESSREIVEHSGGVGILPYYQGKVILVEQFRKPAEEVLLEIPAGKLEKGEETLSCAKRELEEEIGYQSESFKFIADFYTSPGFTDELIYLYLAEDLIQTEQLLDDGEFINVKEFTLEEVKIKLKAGEFKDAKTIIALQYLINLSL